jgi:hypothetical protein
VAVGGRSRTFDCVNCLGRKYWCGGVKCFVGHTAQNTTLVAGK